MGARKRIISRWELSGIIRRTILSWLIAITVEFLLLPLELKDLQQLDGIAAMRPLRILLFLALCFAALSILHRPKIERWLMPGTWTLLMAAGLLRNFGWSFFAIGVLVLVILTVYAWFGWNRSDPPVSQTTYSYRYLWIGITAILGIVFFLFVVIWTVCRVYSFSTPTFDFGIFSQMFHSMKTTGLPLTTVERDGLLSHFHVHVSPIYYLLLPFYVLFPYPATLQVLQAAMMASAVIPLWKIGKQHGLSPAACCAVCALLLLYPAYAGGASYDIHENAFLTPLLLWLFYFLDRQKILLTGVFAILVLCVKEDAAVYIAVIALYHCTRGVLHNNHKTAVTGFGLLAAAIAWFLVVTGFLARVGDGVMTYRYANFMYDGSGSLLSVIKSVLLCPLKALYECVDQDKLSYIGLTVLPLAVLPLFTRRYERYLLLIPYVLINLMSDYQFQHSILFQYNFGSLAFLFYLTVLNLADIRSNAAKTTVLFAAICIACGSFYKEIIPIARIYTDKYQKNQAVYEQIQDTLDRIPEDATVSATTFYTTYLSGRDVLYDIQYASWEHITSTEFIALDCTYLRPYEEYATDGENGLENFCDLLVEEGYTVYAQFGDRTVIYRRIIP